MAKKNLVIVESPSKAKTIGKYLGPDYEVKASMGHVRDLPKSKLGVDIEAGFVPDYQPIKGKEDTIKDLKKAAKASEKVFLATDPDREGEAISWHLKELLDIPDSKVCRVTFNEITQRVVTEAIAAPRTLDTDLVDAQQARRVLDRIVGYQLSPLLWKKIRRGLSAGRVQSVATRLVVEREEEISNFQSQEFWTLEADLGRIAPNLGAFKAKFHGKGQKKLELTTEQQADEIVAAVQGKAFTVSGVKRQEKNRQPAPPFTTSTLQQEASRKLGMTPARTMSIAQQLYEGVDIDGQGTVGLITYMRTDSLRLSDDALAQAKDFIRSRYGAEYYPRTTRRFQTKAGAQDAHEAIRPSDVTLDPESIRKSLTGEQYRLYRLIWSRFLACQMANAVYDSVSIEVEAAGYSFHASHSAVKFSGFTAVYEEGKDEDEDAPQSPLPDLKEGEQVRLNDMKKSQHFTQPPARYTEATLIRALEEKGIGRPSTYAPTISNIISRVYVIKVGKSLRSTPVGEAVTRWMNRNFGNIMDYEFTAKMEELLDTVESGSCQWQELMSNFYAEFAPLLALAEGSEREMISPWHSGEVCPACGKELLIKIGKFGLFLACSGFPTCNFTMPMIEEMPGKCHLCGGRLVKRTGVGKDSGKQFTYYCCEHYNSKVTSKACSMTTFDVPVKDNCPVCGRTMFKKAGRGAKKPFCIHEDCSNFTPEEKRGGWKKPAEGESKKSAGKKTAPKKTAAKKTTAKKKAN
ncbi:MAG: type I DNA topoisomerase [Ruminococcaceae bacterium]|nr:type I DNA topoisomerase [Oscillospiraceae bacterium]